MLKKWLTLMIYIGHHDFALICRATRVHLNLTSADEVKLLESPGFPYHISNDQHYVFSIRFDGEFRAFIRMVFIDLDLPASAILVIHDGKDLQSKQHDVQPYQQKYGVWSRPVLQSGDRYLTVYYYPGQGWHGNFVGFKAKYWATTSRMWPDIPNTSCPTVKPSSNSLGGELDFTKEKWMNSRVFDCIWQIKVPQAKLRVYLQTEISFYDSCAGSNNLTVLEIREGLSSEGSVLATIQNESANRGDFMSNDGLFVRLHAYKSNCYNSSVKLKLLFVSYQEWTKRQNGLECSLSYRTHYVDHVSHNSIAGFLCKDVPDGNPYMCIPSAAQCDKRKHCPRGSDESESRIRCLLRSTTPTLCGIDKKLCPDGSCVEYFEVCDGVKKCEKMCDDGQCVDKDKQCRPNSTTSTIWYDHWWCYLVIPSILIVMTAAFIPCCRRMNHRQLHLAVINSHTSVRVNDLSSLMRRHIASSDFEGNCIDPCSGPPQSYGQAAPPPSYDKAVADVAFSTAEDHTDGQVTILGLPSYEAVSHIRTISITNTDGDATTDLDDSTTPTAASINDPLLNP